MQTLFLFKLVEDLGYKLKLRITSECMDQLEVLLECMDQLEVLLCTNFFSLLVYQAQSCSARFIYFLAYINVLGLFYMRANENTRIKVGFMVKIDQNCCDKLDDHYHFLNKLKLWQDWGLWNEVKDLKEFKYEKSNNT